MTEQDRVAQLLADAAADYAAAQEYRACNDHRDTDVSIVAAEDAAADRSSTR
ncbi:hypothetical protein [Streptomyces sp. NPDC090026]|uniref:hypothetical protein n=1 Tax=Streptomyces sp. NPDC090026 TaxID=3365923 RepID=UPI0038292E36